MEERLKIAIVGTGSMGSVYAGLLGRAGHEIWAIDVWDDHVAAIARDGLASPAPAASFIVTDLRTGRTPDEAGPSDLWVIGTKASAVEAVAARDRSSSPPRRRRDGVPERPRRRRACRPRDRRPSTSLIGIAEGFGSSIPAPGHVHHHGMRLIRIGELHGGLVGAGAADRAGLAGGRASMCRHSPTSI